MRKWLRQQDLLPFLQVSHVWRSLEPVRRLYSALWRLPLCLLNVTGCESSWQSVPLTVFDLQTYQHVPTWASAFKECSAVYCVPKTCPVTAGMTFRTCALLKVVTLGRKPKVVGYQSALEARNVVQARNKLVWPVAASKGVVLEAGDMVWPLLASKQAELEAGKRFDRRFPAALRQLNWLQSTFGEALPAASFSSVVTDATSFSISSLVARCRCVRADVWTEVQDVQCGSVWRDFGPLPALRSC